MFNRNHHQFYEIEQRLKKLEDKAFGSKKDSNIAHQMLLLKFTGLLDIITQLNTTNENKYKILSKILNRDKDNIKKAYLQIASFDDDIMTPGNLQAVIDIFQDNGLAHLTEKPKTILQKVEVKWAKPDE